MFVVCCFEKNNNNDGDDDDEFFSFFRSRQLTSDQKNIENSLIHFIIKDQDFLGNEFLGEAYMDLKNIPTTDSSVSIHSLSQIHLKLSRPTNFNSEAFKALEHRIGDKLAREFLKKQRTKISP